MTAIAAIDIPFRTNPTASVATSFELLDDVQVMQLADPEWSIDGIFHRRSITVIYGPPESAKTTLEAGIAVATATGRDWFGHAIVHHGSSLYIGEDVAGWKRRLAAQKSAIGIPLDQAVGVYTFNETVDLCDQVSVDGFIRFVKDTRGVFERVTFDTFASVTPGAAENSSEDMTLAVRHVKKIRDELRAGVCVIHHTNASGNRERGHSALRGAADAMISVTPVDDVVVVECSKQRNGPRFKTLTLKLVPVESGGCVLRAASDVMAGATLTAAQAKVLDVLREIGGEDGATKSAWRQSCQDVPERTFHRAAATVASRGLVQKINGRFKVGGQS